MSCARVTLIYLKTVLSLRPCTMCVNSEMLQLETSSGLTVDLIKLDYKDFTIEAVNRIGKSLALSPHQLHRLCYYQCKLNRKSASAQINYCNIIPRNP